tara:strand:+ start:1576 stop:1815 length:240 start_codon:yes stop_codon:yes gene_type:complete
MINNPPIEETLERLEELVRGQQKALDMSNKIISMKNRMIQLCEEETALYKREAKRQLITSFVLGVILIVSSMIYIISLL